MTDTRPVRASENLDWDVVANYLRRELDTDGTFDVEQFAGGHSNLTYLIRFGDKEMVLRRPPFGPVPARAHDMAREFRLLAAVHPRFPLAPKPFVLCEDTSLIGSVFYVMERRRGLVIRAQEPPPIAGNVALRRRVSGSVIDTLADLHAVDVAAHGLDVLGKPAGFVARQIRGWTERWHGSKTSEVPEMESLAAWLEARIPKDPARPTLVHGDYKLDNIMLDAAQPERVTGVFDWEMSAVGDPLIDVGLVVCYWIHIAGANDDALATVTTNEGWFNREQILERYAKRSGRNVDAIALYEVFAVFKVAVVIQQIYARFVRGQTDDPRFERLGDRVASLARMATTLAERG
jgi:aminoglycoside phosphotransferase (APT) family kinase protein